MQEETAYDLHKAAKTAKKAARLSEISGGIQAGMAIAGMFV